MSLRSTREQMNVKRAMVTQLLRVRLAHQALVDVDIMLLEKLRMPSTLDAHFGGKIGCFFHELAVMTFASYYWPEVTLTSP